MLTAADVGWKIKAYVYFVDRAGFHELLASDSFRGGARTGRSGAERTSQRSALPVVPNPPIPIPFQYPSTCLSLRSNLLFLWGVRRGAECCPFVGPSIKLRRIIGLRSRPLGHPRAGGTRGRRGIYHWPDPCRLRRPRHVALTVQGRRPDSGRHAIDALQRRLTNTAKQNRSRQRLLISPGRLEMTCFRIAPSLGCGRCRCVALSLVPGSSGRALKPLSTRFSQSPANAINRPQTSAPSQQTAERVA